MLVAVGRVPNGRNIGADRAGVNVDERGFIRVDAQQRTNVENIFAIGDVVGPPMLAHKASHEGKSGCRSRCGSEAPLRARVIPSVAYTDPEIAWAGLPRKSRRSSRGSSAARECFPGWRAVVHSHSIVTMGSRKSCSTSSRIAVLGLESWARMQATSSPKWRLRIEMGCDAADIGLTIHPHPTLSETVAFAAEAYEGTLTDLYVPKK